MANNCYFTMKIAGKPDQVIQFAHTLNKGFGRVYSFETDPHTAEKDSRPGSNLISMVGQGDCAWSISTAMPKLQEESARLGLCIEAFSSEPGIGFQEHYLYDKGTLLVDECVDYIEYWVDGYGEKEIKELLEDLKISREELYENLNESGDYCIGGFDNFGDFEDLFQYWTPENLKELADVTQELPEKLHLWARVGVSLEVTPETYQKLLKGDPDVLLDVLHGKGGEAYIDSETYFPDIAENFDLAERSYDLGREPFVLDKIQHGEKLAIPDTPINLKVMVEGGLVQDVLKNSDIPIDLEIVDLDVQTANHEKLLHYWDSIASDPSYVSCGYGSAADYIEDLPDAGEQDKPSLDDIIREATEAVKNRPSPTPFPEKQKNEPEKDQ